MAEWITSNGALERQFTFTDFVEAMVFVNRVAEIAEEADHHPDIAISWNKVTLRLWDHHTAAITDKDHVLAARFDALSE